MGLFSYILFGGLAGWVASLLTGRSRRTGCLVNILVGIAGALIGGFLARYLSGSSFSISWDFKSFIVAVLGAILFLAVTGIATRRHRD
ncbi:MAG: GlsB/YeaQ/YmgE family stress response membrane protein [Chloroflexi bacterium]|nr:GlsB/YeaQ/YmgE family stress response membrane protein [Chloroflexota bacterium]